MSTCLWSNRVRHAARGAASGATLAVAIVLCTSCATNAETDPRATGSTGSPGATAEDKPALAPAPVQAPPSPAPAAEEAVPKAAPEVPPKATVEAAPGAQAQGGGVCDAVCQRTVERGCGPRPACMSACAEVMDGSICRAQMDTFMRCALEHPAERWECSDNGVATIRDGYCDQQQLAFINCFQASLAN